MAQKVMLVLAGCRPKAESLTHTEAKPGTKPKYLKCPKKTTGVLCHLNMKKYTQGIRQLWKSLSALKH
jgi:hypothetical protein